MGGISSTIRLNDAMTNPLKNINKALSLVIDNYEKMQRVSGSGLNTSEMVKAKTYLSQADRQLDEIVTDTSKATEGQRQYNAQVQKGQSATESLGSKVKGMVSALGGLYVVKQGISLLNECSEKASNLAQAETKLGEVMHAMQGASSAQVQEVKDLSKEISANGVVGKTALINGAQQVSTYFHQTDAVKTLLPKMADLAVQMHGVNVTQEDMVNIGNMFGKVMTGQVGALRRAGISFDEYQEKVMKNGTEMEKANMLSQVITQNVGNMNEAMANTPEGAIAMIKKDFEGIKTSIGESLRQKIVDFYSSIHDSLPAVQSLASVFSRAVSIITTGLTNVIKFAGKIVSFFQNNWSVIKPIILGVAFALMFLKTATIGYNAVMRISNLLNRKSGILASISAARSAIKRGATLKEAAATKTATGAQAGMNAALLACPLTWIIIAIIAIIAAIYLVVAAINKVTGSTISATGVICGAVAVLGSIIINIVIGVINAIIQLVWTFFVEPFIGIIEWILNVANGGFDSFGGAVANLIGNIISWFLSLGKVVTTIIDAIFGTDWTSGLSSLQNEVTSWGKNDNAITISREAPQIDGRIEYGSAYDAGYNFGNSVDDKVSSLFNSNSTKNNTADDVYDTYTEEEIASNTADIASNTKDIADELDVTSDQLKYIREYAEREAINRFTTANVNVNMTNNNNISSDSDVDGILDAMTTGIKKQMNIVAEGGM